MKFLPQRPNLDFLIREAKTVKSRHRNTDPTVCAVIGHYDTSLHGLSNDQIFGTRFSILDAQKVVARQYSFSSWSRMKRFVELSQKGSRPLDANLAKSILKHQNTMIATREDIKNSKGKSETLWTKYKKLALESRKILNPAYDTYGYPGPDVVGSECLYPLMCLAANAVYDSEFQKRTITLMHDALPEGATGGYWYAALNDRYLNLSDKPTVFGTGFGSYRDENGKFRFLDIDVIDPDNLNKRRAHVGYDPFDDYIVWAAKEAEDQNWNIGTRDRALAEKERLSVQGGYIC